MLLPAARALSGCKRRPRHSSVPVWGRGGRRLLLGPAAALDASDPADFQVLHLPAVISVLTTLLATRLPPSRPSFPPCHAACMHTACWMRATAGTSVWTRQWSWGCAPSTTLPSATQPREAPCRVRQRVGGGAGRGGRAVRAAPRGCRRRCSGQGSRAAAAQPRCSLPQHGPFTASVLSCGYCTLQDTLPSSVRPVSNPPLPSDHKPPCPNPSVPTPPSPPSPAVYHVTQQGWTKVRGEDVGELHFKYYPDPQRHPCNSADPLAM